MSRSYRHNLWVSWTTSRSEAWDKKMWHRRNRHKERLNLLSTIRKVREDHITTHEYEVSNPYNMSKDGRRGYRSLRDVDPHYSWWLLEHASFSDFISRRDRAIRKILFK